MGNLKRKSQVFYTLIKNWIEDNKLVTLVTTGLIVILIILISILNGRSAGNPEDALSDDQKITEKISKEQVKGQKVVQDETGLTLEIPSKAEIQDAIKANFDGQTDLKYTDTAVKKFVSDKFGEDIGKLYSNEILPDPTLSPLEQAVLNIDILEELGKSKFATSGYSLYEVISTINGTVSRVLSYGYQESSEEEPYTADLLYYYKDIKDGIGLFINNKYTKVTDNNINYINPSVYWDGSQYNLRVLINPTKQMTIEQLMGQLKQTKITINGQINLTGDPKYIEDYGDALMVKEYQSALKEVLHPSQVVVLNLPIGKSLASPREYVEVGFNNNKVVIQKGDSRVRVDIN